MKNQLRTITVAFLVLFAVSSCKKEEKSTTTNQQSEATKNVISTKDLNYKVDSTDYKSFVVYKGDSTQIKPVVYIIPEWWGINDYVKNRAMQIAELGYLAVVVDMYGNAKSVDNPGDAEKLATPFYGKEEPAKKVFEAALSNTEKLPNSNKSKMAAIGYCFGGAMALNMARLGEPLKGVVSFHGNLMTGVSANNNNVKVLVLNGADDSFVPQTEIDAFKKEMEAAKVDYQFINYPGAIHSFTNPNSTEVGKKYNLKVAYNKEADEKSWEEMKNFFNKIFK